MSQKSYTRHLKRFKSLKVTTLTGGERVIELIESLLVNKKRYGYISFPCRLASGDCKKDQDILCPCVYREADVKEYGSCYCNFYVSKEWNKDKIPHEYVPERRPPEKSIRNLQRATGVGPCVSTP